MFNLIIGLIRLFFIFLVILLIFALVPQKFWDTIKPYFNWEVLISTLKYGWFKFWNFIKETTGLDLGKIPEFIKLYTGLDIIKIWESAKNSFINLLQKLINILK